MDLLHIYTYFSISIKYKTPVLITKLKCQSSLQPYSLTDIFTIYFVAVGRPKICLWLWYALFFQHATHTMDSQVRESGGKCQLHQPCQAMVGWSQLGIGCGSPHSVMLGNGQWTWQAVLLLPMLPEYSQRQVCHFKRRHRDSYNQKKMTALSRLLSTYFTTLVCKRLKSKEIIKY